MTSAQTEKASSRLRRAGRARAASTARRAAAYTVLGLLCFLCLFFFLHPAHQRNAHPF